MNAPELAHLRHTIIGERRLAMYHSRIYLPRPFPALAIPRLLEGRSGCFKGFSP